MPFTLENRSGRGSTRNALHTYRLKFTEDGKGVQRDVEFEAHDAAMALILAHKEAANRSAELWCDGHRVCSIKKTDHGFWEIGIHRPIAAVVYPVSQANRWCDPIA